MPDVAPPENAALLECPDCSSPLPLRLPVAGEVAGSWECHYCRERFYAVFVDTAPPDLLENARPCADVNPRVISAGQTVEQMHKREGRAGGRVLDERRSARRVKEMAGAGLAGDIVVRVRTVDLSAGGLGFVSDAPLSVETAVTIVFESLPGSPEVEAFVRSCREMGGGLFRIGVSFAHASPGSQDASPESEPV